MNRYEKAWRFLFNKLPNWKREALTSDLQTKNNSSLLDVFTKEVISLAEGNQVIPELIYAEEHEMTLNEKN
jgi:hypothetical protein